MDEIANMTAFVKVVETASFTAAAFALNCSTSSISKKINRLEYDVGAKLINRSTHGLNLTEAGAIYLERARKILYEIESARDSVQEVTQSLSGTLKVHMTPGTGIRIALPAVLQFIKSYPTLSVEISVRPDVIDILRLGFDVSILSAGIGDAMVNHSGVEARELSRARYLICAAPAYFQRYGKPTHPQELAEHNCLISMRQSSPHKWWFRNGRKRFAVNVHGNLVADDWTIIYEATLAGLGISRVLNLPADLQPNGQLEPIFSDMLTSDRAVWAVVPRLRPMPRKIDLFLKFLSERLKWPEKRATSLFVAAKTGAPV